MTILCCVCGKVVGEILTGSKLTLGVNDKNGGQANYAKCDRYGQWHNWPVPPSILSR